MVTYFAKEQGRIAVLPDFRPDCWAHLGPPFAAGEVRAFAERFGIPADFLSDSLDIDERSRYEREEDVRLVMINSPVANATGREDNDAIFVTAPIGIVLTPEVTVTVTAVDNTIMQRFVDGLVRGFDPRDYRGFVLHILEQNVYRFTAYLRELNKRRNAIERVLYDSSRNKDLRS